MICEKKVVLLGVCIISMILVYLIGIKIRKAANDPYMDIAKEIYRVETALKEVDENWERESITKITPYTYINSKGDTFVYYCCNTAYFGSNSYNTTDLNTSVIGQVIDLAIAENIRECKVNSWNAIQCEFNGNAYLCWTISPEISCVLEYTPGSIAEADIFKIAASVQDQD